MVWWKRIGCLVAGMFLCVALTTEVSADEGTEDRDWQQLKIRFFVDGKESEIIDSIYTSGQTEPGVALLCSENLLRVRFATEAVDMRSAISEYPKSARQVTGRLLLNDEEATRDLWAFFPRQRILAPPDRPTAAKIFNATIRGDQVEIDAGRYEVRYGLPPVDDVFRDFVERCRQVGAL